MGMAILLTGSAFAVQLPPPFTDCLGRGRTEHDWSHKLTLKNGQIAFRALEDRCDAQ